MPPPLRKTDALFRKAMREYANPRAYKPTKLNPAVVVAGKMPPLRMMSSREQQKERVRELTRKMGAALGKPTPSVYTRGRK